MAIFSYESCSNLLSLLLFHSPLPLPLSHTTGAGHTCGIADLTLTRSAEEERRRLLEKVKTDAQYGLDAFLSNASVAEGMARR